MQSKRQLLARLAYASGASLMLGQLFSLARPSLVILAYHRVTNYQPDYPFDLELISASPGQFEWQVQWLAKNTNPITFQDLGRIRAGEMSAPRRPLIITFDDGFEDNYSEAFPILAKFNVPATFFVSTGYINTDRSYWFDGLSHLIMNPEFEQFAMRSIDIDCGTLGGTESRRKTCAMVLKKIKQAPYEKQALAINEIGELAAASGSLEKNRAMTWSQLREMSQNGMEIGSHGVEHLMLSKLSDQQLRSELVGSKEDIEQKINTEVTSIAYPVGGKDACDERVFDFARKAGYQFGCTYQSGRNSMPRLENLALKRVAIERYCSNEQFICAARLQSAV